MQVHQLSIKAKSAKSGVILIKYLLVSNSANKTDAYTGRIIPAGSHSPKEIHMGFLQDPQGRVMKVNINKDLFQMIKTSRFKKLNCSIMQINIFNLNRGSSYKKTRCGQTKDTKK
jgi:hypothetical protein